MDIAGQPPGAPDNAAQFAGTGSSGPGVPVPGPQMRASHRHSHPHYRHGWWWKTLLAGLAVWILTIIVTAVTRNTNLIPTLILIGSFLVPFCVVMFVAERIAGTISLLQVILAFFVAGVFGVLGASLLEFQLRQTLLLYLAVGLIEEFVKGIILVIIGWRVRPKNALQGALLGAVVGAGFAAFESAGYAFNAAITAHGIDLIALLHTEVLRAVLAPVAHVLWTAILGAVIFGMSRDSRRYHWSWFILLTYAGVAVLHGLWDSMGGIASLLAFFFTGAAFEQLRYGFLPSGAAAEVQSTATVLYIVGMVVISAIGVTALTLIVRAFRRRSRGTPRPGVPVAAVSPSVAAASPYGAGAPPQASGTPPHFQQSAPAAQTPPPPEPEQRA